MPQTAFTFTSEYTRSVQLDYLLSLPRSHGEEPGKKWPMILFLHGAGERGNDVNQVKLHGIARVTEERELPFVTLSPQCPPNHWWSDFLLALNDLVEMAIETLDVDPQRIYLTGLSMGGFGTWHLAAEYPYRFAAIAPICGSGPWHAGFPQRASEIAHIPAWVFHGAKDPVVPLEASQVMVDQLKACGANVRFTIYPEADHDSWTETYNNPALYEWFLENKREG